MLTALPVRPDLLTTVGAAPALYSSAFPVCKSILAISIVESDSSADLKSIEELSIPSEQSKPKPDFMSLPISPADIAESTAALPPVPMPSLSIITK